MLEWIKQNRRKLLLPGLCCLLGVLLGISSIQIQEEGTNIKEDRTLQTFQPKKYQNLIAGEQDSKQFKWTLEAVSKLQLHLKQDRQAGTRLETVISKWGKPQKFSFTKTAGDAKTQIVLTYAAKQTDQGKKSVSLWFEQVENKGYRLTMVDATNLLEHQDQEASGKKEAGKSKEVQGVDQILNRLGNPQRLVWDELLEGGKGFRASYQEQGQPEVVMEFKVKGSKLIMV